jgi:hypothetical protein
MVVGMAEVG